MAFPLPQSTQHTIPRPWSVQGLYTDSSSPVRRHFPTAKVTWTILVGPTILLHFLMWYPNSIWLFSVPSDVVGFVSTIIIHACKFPRLSPSPSALQVPPQHYLAIKVSVPWISPLAGDFLQPSRYCSFQHCRVSIRLFR